MNFFLTSALFFSYKGEPGILRMPVVHSKLLGEQLDVSTVG